jgi:hypothetical protein
VLFFARAFLRSFLVFRAAKAPTNMPAKGRGKGKGKGHQPSAAEKGALAAGGSSCLSFLSCVPSSPPSSSFVHLALASVLPSPVSLSLSI